MRQIILFTGHRDKIASGEELEQLALESNDSVWMHGDAVGFDRQVNSVAEIFNIQRIVVPAAYLYAGDKSAPLRRNDLMVDLCTSVIALYDGRKKGGTYYTIKRAELKGKPVKILTPKERKD